ncbi:hypothetical protein ZWY2020_020885 [Hordeum vulgare]|nr:hypothetical protein ZWY2020_020885 [Hordeum vulgare]
MEMWILPQFHGRDMLSYVSAAMWEVKMELAHSVNWETIVHILQDSPPSGSPLMRGGAVVEHVDSRDIQVGSYTKITIKNGTPIS